MMIKTILFSTAECPLISTLAKQMDYIRTMTTTRLLPLLACFALLSVPSPAPGGDAVPDDRVIPYYTGTVYPTPQQAQYRDEFVPLGRVGLLLGKDVAPEDARVAVLVERLKRRGSQPRIVASADDRSETLILVGDTGTHQALLGTMSIPDKPEGYLLHCAKNGAQNIVFLKGHDFHGLLWAITSFNQLITTQNERPVARAATIHDYPEYPGIRGYTPFKDDDQATAAWFGVNMLRSNVVIYRQLRKPANWRLPLRDETQFNDWKARIQKIGAQLTPLQITWYDSILPFSGHVGLGQVRSKSEEDFQLVVKAGMALAEAGGHLCLLYDDYRFFLSPEDSQDFGSAREADVYFLNKVYAAVSAKYPNFRILFCPPFYFGAGGSDDTTTYGESRDAYLAAVGKLPKAIDIYWSGPRVKSTHVSAEQLGWFTGLAQRKPVFWQNACGTYHGSPYYAYPGEPMKAWRDWYDDAFLRGIAFYAYNGEDAYINMTISDALWNRRGYDPAASGEMAAKKLAGPDNYSQLVEAFKALEAMDDYGWFEPTALAARNVELVRKQTEELTALYNKAPPALKSRWLMLGTFVGYRQKYLQSLLKNPNLKEATEVDARVQELALKETETDAKASVVLTPNQFSAGREARFYSWREVPRRHVVWINGAQSKAPTLQTTFQLGFPLMGDSELIIAGLDDNAPAACRIRIQMNGNTIFEGANPYPSDRWSTKSFRVKGAMLRDGVPNVLRIDNLEDSDSMTGAPWFMLSYAVLRPAK